GSANNPRVRKAPKIFPSTWPFPRRASLVAERAAPFPWRASFACRGRDAPASAATNSVAHDIAAGLGHTPSGLRSATAALARAGLGASSPKQPKGRPMQEPATILALP